MQKAKIRWAIEGDENSKYFHAIINKKRANLSVKGIMVDGDWIVEPDLVKQEFRRHFTDRFQDPGSRDESLQLFIFPAVEAGIFKGYKIDPSTTLSHLFYADDAVFIEVSSFLVSGIPVGMALPFSDNSLMVPIISVYMLEWYVLSAAFKFDMGSIITEVNSLKSKVSLLISHCKIRVGKGYRMVRFWMFNPYESYEIGLLGSIYPFSSKTKGGVGRRVLRFLVEPLKLQEPIPFCVSYSPEDSPSVSQGTTSKAVVQSDLTNLPEKSWKQSYISDRKDCWNLVSMELHI
ncbi:hypothetical protein Tco_0264819 [Tanacetum coccineum]